MKHISKVNVYGKQHLSQKEINDCTNQDNSKIYCNKHKRKFTPQNNIHQFAKVYYIDKDTPWDYDLLHEFQEHLTIIDYLYKLVFTYNFQ